MDIKIAIGKDVEGSRVFRVPETFKWVSRQHAFLYWHDGVATLEDDNSTNGTFVNGRRITRAQVQENDTVWLGGIGSDDKCYQLDLRPLFASCRKLENAQRMPPSPQAVGVKNQSPEVDDTQRTDYTREFEQLKKAYIDYHAELSRLKKNTNMKMQLPRVLLSLIPVTLGVIFMFVLGFGTMGFMAMMMGSVLSGVIGTLTMGRATSRQEKLSEDILDLQLEYQNKYKCPKCGKQYSLDLHWKKLQADGKCPFGCGARFV